MLTQYRGTRFCNLKSKAEIDKLAAKTQAEVAYLFPTFVL